MSSPVIAAAAEETVADAASPIVVMSEVGEVATDTAVVDGIADLVGGTLEKCGNPTCLQGSWLVSSLG